MKKTWYDYLKSGKKPLCCFLFAVTFSCLQAIGQGSPDPVPFKDILKTLEQRFDVVFSYADEFIAEVEVMAPPDSLALQSSLAYLEKQSGFTFEFLNDRFIALRRGIDDGSIVLCGYVYDGETGSPVATAMVSWGSGYTISSDNGYFEIVSTDSPRFLNINHVAYSPDRVMPGDSRAPNCMEVMLRPKAIELEEVLVSNYLGRGINKKTNGSMEVKTQELQVLPGMSEPDVLHTMQTLPGIYSPSESVSDINIRGGTNDQSLILWDGIKMYQPSHFYGLITSINPYFTDHVLLTKNGTEARWGEGVSGTIDIRSDDDVATDWAGGGGVNMLSADGHVTIPLSPKASIGLAGRRSIADLIRTPTYNNYFDRAFRNTDVIADAAPGSIVRSDPDFYFYDLSGKANIQFSEADKLEVSLLHIANDLSYEEGQLVDGTVQSRISSLTQKSMAAGGQYDRTWNSMFRTSFQGYLSAYQLKGINNDLLNDQRLLQDNSVFDVGLKAESRMIVNHWVDLSAGVQLTEVAVTNVEELSNPDFSRLVREVFQSQAGFTEANLTSPSGQTHGRLGVRVNYYQAIAEWSIEPRLYFRQELAGGIFAEVKGEQKSQFTTQVIDLQNDFLGVEKRRWVLSNGVDVPLQLSKQLSAGLSYNQHRLLVSLEGYVKQVNGIITSSQSFQNQFEFLRSAGSYSVKGAELLVKKDFSEWFPWLSYTLAKNTYQFPELAVGAFPHNLDIRHNLTQGVSYAGEHLQLSTSVNWHSGRPFTPVNEVNPVAAGRISYELPNSARLKDYFRIDISGRYKFPLGKSLKGQAGFSIWNLTAYENVLSAYYRMGEDDAPVNIQQRGLKLTLNTSFRVTF